MADTPAAVEVPQIPGSGEGVDALRAAFQASAEAQAKSGVTADGVAAPMAGTPNHMSLVIAQDPAGKEMPGDFWFPVEASTYAGNVDWLYDAILWISLVFFIPMMIAMVYFAIVYRQRKEWSGGFAPAHNTPLEITWTVIPLLLVIWIFVYGFIGFMNMTESPGDAYEIAVNAKKWSWLFQYPNGAQHPELHAYVNQPVRLVMASDDVLHSLYIAAFRTKQDIVPGRYTTTWFQATAPGEYALQCTEYCGDDHSNMLAKVVVHATKEDFDAWVTEAADVFGGGKTPEQAGRYLYETRGCAGCHAIDATKKVGPSFANNYGTDRELEGGSSIVMDENYIRESIIAPQAKIRKGYPRSMPSYKGQLKESEIGAIIAFIKSLKDGAPAAPAEAANQ